MLSKRFEEIILRIPECETLLDIGCDHGKITYEILKLKICKFALLSDISEPSLMKAKKLISDEFPKSKYFVSDGVNNISDAFDFCVIAGMGGHEIAKILKSDKINNAIIQPMNNLVFLRKQLCKLGYTIITDEIIFDERYYNIILIERGQCVLNEFELIFGKTNLVNRSEEFINYLHFQLRVQYDIVKSLSSSEKLDNVLLYIEKIKKVLEV